MITNNAPLRNQSMKKVGEVNLRAAATIERSHSMKWMRQHKKSKTSMNLGAVNQLGKESSVSEC